LGVYMDLRRYYPGKDKVSKPSKIGRPKAVKFTVYPNPLIYLGGINGGTYPWMEEDEPDAWNEFLYSEIREPEDIWKAEREGEGAESEKEKKEKKEWLKKKNLMATLQEIKLST